MHAAVDNCLMPHLDAPSPALAAGERLRQSAGCCCCYDGKDGERGQG